jgi:exonuclease VII small subunit
MNMSTGRYLSCRIRTWMAIGLCALGLGAPGARGQDAATLVRDAGQAYRTAERAFFGGKIAEAGVALAEARSLVDKASAVAPKDAQAAALKTKIQRLEQQIEKKTGAAPAASAMPQPAAPSAPSSGAGAASALPSGAVQLLREITQRLDRVDRALDDSLATANMKDRDKTARSHLEEAQAAMATLEQRHGARIAPDNPDVKACRDRIARADAQITAFVSRMSDQAASAGAAAAAAESASAGWLARLRPYVIPSHQPGHDKTRYLVPSATMDEAEMNDRVRIFSEASQVLKELRAAGVTAKTEDLAAVEKQLDSALAEFRDSMKSYGARELDAIRGKLDHAGQFIREQQQKSSGNQAFLTIDKDILPDLRRAIGRVTVFLAADDPQPADLLKRLAGLEADDAALRQKRVAETRVTPGRYAGPDKGDIVAQAADIVAKSHADARVLRTSVLSADWKEESALEFTDTTRSAIRHRVTRSVTVEVAVKRAGGAFLYTLDISKDRRTDGSWGGPYGHIMFTRPILEENVAK